MSTAIQFKARVSGGVLRVPRRHTRFKNGTFKIIMLGDDEEKREDAALLERMEEGRKTPLVPKSKITAIIRGVR